MSQALQIGLLIAGGISLLGYFISLEWRIRNLRNELLQTKEKVVDQNISANVHSLSDAELDSELAKRLGTAASSVPMLKP